MFPVSFSWAEVRELTASGVCWGADAKEHARCRTLDAIVGELEGFCFLLLPVQAMLPTDLVDGVSISLSGDDMAFLVDCFNQRMTASPSFPDGEEADNDQLDLLLPLQSKLQFIASSQTNEVSYRLVVTGEREE